MPHAVAFLFAQWSIFGQMSAALVYLPPAEAEDREGGLAFRRIVLDILVFCK